MSRKFYLIFILFLSFCLYPQKILAASSDALSFTFEDKTFNVPSKELATWHGRQMVQPANIFIKPAENLEVALQKFAGKQVKTSSSAQTYNYTLAPIYEYIKNLASTTLDSKLTEPYLKIENNRAVEFTPPQNGLKTDVYKSALEALFALQKDEEESALTVVVTKPQGSLAQSNNLGINELIAHGVSNFSGSPKNRRHNISVGVGKFKGIIISQGEEFSFNNYLGPVEEEQGFLPELVIKKEGTVPELGGGLCQVSSTTFRAAMAAGVPITQRRNHAYAVVYYSPQGTDATIYPGVVDLKFINDTPGAILVWPHLEAKDTLIFDFYGTKDSRQVTLNKPNVYDRMPDGSMKATWTREVIKADGTPRTDVFKSVYQSPALFHKEEKFVTASSTPTTPPTVQPN